MEDIGLMIDRYKKVKFIAEFEKANLKVDVVLENEKYCTLKITSMSKSQSDLTKEIINNTNNFFKANLN